LTGIRPAWTRPPPGTLTHGPAPRPPRISGSCRPRPGRGATPSPAWRRPSTATRRPGQRKRLRKLGVRRRHWAVETRPVTGWLSLTGTERTVSELVAQGLTNQQVADQMFISVHTVAFHLRQVFRKLAISSRVELARIAVAEGSARAG
jgi:DNA-binding CsgD family transcriptional regulator